VVKLGDSARNKGCNERVKMMPNESTLESGNCDAASPEETEQWKRTPQRGISQEQSDNFGQSQSDQGQDSGQFNSDAYNNDSQESADMDNEGDLQPNDDVTVGKWIRSNEPHQN